MFSSTIRKQKKNERLCVALLCPALQGQLADSVKNCIVIKSAGFLCLDDIIVSHTQAAENVEDVPRTLALALIRCLRRQDFVPRSIRCILIRVNISGV